MNNLVKQDPWSVMPRLQDEINRLFGTLAETDSSSATATWVPAVDIQEYADRFELYLDVPGVDPNDVELTLEDDVLTLSGQRSSHSNGKQGEEPTYRRIERGQEWRIDGVDSEATQGCAAANSDRILTGILERALPWRGFHIRATAPHGMDWPALNDARHN